MGLVPPLEGRAAAMVEGAMVEVVMEAEVTAVVMEAAATAAAMGAEEMEQGRSS